ncbi:MAG: chromate transporter [Clostridia bacterium]|nr:chromate transporter [Clostridia bacterium]
MIYLRLFLAFLKVGAFTFGGGYAAVPLIRETVLSNGWLDDAALSELIAISESTPGPIMVNLATYVGSTQAGFWGAAAATLAVVIPSFVFIIILVKVLNKALVNEGLKASLGALKPCIAGIILATGFFMALSNITGPLSAIEPDYTALILTLILAAIYFGSRKILKNGLSPILLIIISGAAGIAVKCLF